MDNQELLISVKHTHLQSIPDIAENLKKVGLKNIKTMSKLGIITGSIPEHQISAVSQVKGVDRVERSREIHLASPDSPIQ